MLSGHGARIIGIPYNATGLDVDCLERTVIETRPRLLILSSIGHNPTGLSLPIDSVKRVVNLASKHDFWIFEDDVYADLATTPVRRLAAAGGLSRVIYANSFSKTLASNIRVGFMACEASIKQRLSEAKLLGGFTTPELNERLVHKLLVEGHYSSHVSRLCKRLSMHRARMRRLLTSNGVAVLGESGDGLFLWANMRTNTTVLAEICSKHGLLLAPGSLFSPRQEPSTWMRVNVTTSPGRCQCDARASPGAESAGSLGRHSRRRFGVKKTLTVDQIVRLLHVDVRRTLFPVRSVQVTE